MVESQVNEVALKYVADDNSVKQTNRYKAYPEYKESGVEWLGEIPNHWRVRRVKEIANVISGYPFDSKKFDPSKGTPLIRIRDIRSLQTEVYFDGYVPKEALIKNGNVLIGMDGDFNVAKWQGGEAALNQRVACVRHDNIDLQQFLYYLMPFNMQVVNDLTYYTTVKHLSVTDILKTKFSLPPNNELQNIISFLDYETAKIDTLIEKQQRLIELLTEKRQAVISHAVTKGLNPNVPMKDSGVEWLGEVPAHWEYATVRRYLLEHRQGYYTKDSYVGDGVKLLRITDLRELGNISIKNCPMVPEHSSLKNYLLKEGDVVFARTGGAGSFGVVPELEEEVAYASYLIRFRFLPKYFNTSYLRYMLMADSFQLAVKQNIHGGVNQNIHAEDIKNTYVACPPIIEQQQISSYLDEQTKKYSQLINKASYQIQLMQERRTALISAAVTGKIDVRDWVKPE